MRYVIKIIAASYWQSVVGAGVKEGKVFKRK